MRSICSFLETVTDILIALGKFGVRRLCPQIPIPNGIWGQRRLTPNFNESQYLEHSRRTSRTGTLAFFLRRLFNIVHVRCSLRQDVMELISKTLERKSFFQEFADTRGAE